MTEHGAPKRRSGSRRRVIWSGVAAGIAALVVLFGVLVSAGGDASGDPAPDIALPNFEGETVRLSGFAGQGVVINYWASWCLPCLAELPGFEQVYQRYRGQVVFWGINLADDPTAALAVAAQTGITYPLAVDASGDTFAEFGAFAMPTTIFVSPDGKVLELHSGPLTAEQLEAKIASHFGA